MVMMAKDDFLTENKVKRMLRLGEVVYGPILQALSSVTMIRLLARAGFDFVYLDMEHGPFDYESLAELCPVCVDVGLIPIVRPPSQQPYQLARILDCGAMGLLVPHVESVEQADSILKSIKYHPLGQRGYSSQGAHTAYQKLPTRKYMDWANQEILVGFLIESMKGVQQLDEILSKPGVDWIVIGRGDLSQDMGIPGEINSPAIQATVEACFQICRRRKIPFGILVSDHESALHWIKQGAQMINYGSDITIFTDLLKSDLDQLRLASDSLVRSMPKEKIIS